MGGLSRFQLTVIVTMIAVRMMKMPINQVIYMISMRHGFVPAARSMHVRLIMAPAAVLRRASVWIGRRHLDRMFINVIAMHVVQMSVMQVVNVSTMVNRCMSAIWPVHMRVVRVL